VRIPPAGLPLSPAVYQGDCFELLKHVPHHSVRLILVDSPYDTGREDNLETMGRTSMNYPWDGPVDNLKWLELADNALMPGGSIVSFYDWKKINELTNIVELELGYVVKRPVIWRKSNPMPGNKSRLPVQAIEMGFWAVKPGAPWVFNCPEELTYSDFLWFDTGIPRTGKGKPRHEAMKPEQLFGDLISILTHEGDVVLDPFCGSGTTAVAAVNRNRIPICFELDKGWAAEATLALKRATRGRP
jgi:site-specific DNA-methyltransferase (adenine-specific)